MIPMKKKATTAEIVLIITLMSAWIGILISLMSTSHIQATRLYILILVFIQLFIGLSVGLLVKKSN
jgi:succinate dehydrogenase hydrophobic anchor subunit